MRVLVVHNAYQQPGGEDAVVAAEDALLRERGEDIHLHLVDNDGIQGTWRKAGVFLQTGYNTHAREALKRRIDHLRPEVVHVHNTFPRLSPSIFDACIEAGVPSVLTLHNFRLLCPTATLHHAGRSEERSLREPCWWTVPAAVYRGSPIGTLAVAAMVEGHKRRGTWRDRVTRFIALSAFAREKFIEGGLPAHRISIKPNSAPDVVGAQKAVRRSGALFVGRLTEDKGVRTLIQAWRDVAFPLTMVGDGPLYAWAQSNAPAHVRLTGRLSASEVSTHMLASQLLVAPSHWYEMFPMVFPEAFACALPVLASDTPSLRPLVRPGVIGEEAGELAPPDDPQALAAAARRMLEDPARLERLGANARSIYTREYTPEANYRQLMAIYDQAVAEGPRLRRALKPFGQRRGLLTSEPALDHANLRGA